MRYKIQRVLHRYGMYCFGGYEVFVRKYFLFVFPYWSYQGDFETRDAAVDFAEKNNWSAS